MSKKNTFGNNSTRFDNPNEPYANYTRRKSKGRIDVRKDYSKGFGGRRSQTVIFGTLIALYIGLAIFLLTEGQTAFSIILFGLLIASFVVFLIIKRMSKL